MLKLFLFLLERPRRPRFSTGQLDKLADIFANLGILLIGSVILPRLIPGIDMSSLPLIICGGIGALSFWAIAVSLVKEVQV